TAAAALAAGRRTAHMDGMSDREVAPGKACPICGKPAAGRLRPFCSRRCADVDLNRWLGGVYAVPVKAEGGGDGTPAAGAGGPEAGEGGGAGAGRGGGQPEPEPL